MIMRTPREPRSSATKATPSTAALKSQISMSSRQKVEVETHLPVEWFLLAKIFGTHCTKKENYKTRKAGVVMRYLVISVSRLSLFDSSVGGPPSHDS